MHDTLSFIARENCPYLDKLDSYADRIQKDYLYSNLHQWKINIDGLSEDELRQLVNIIKYCEEFVDVNVEVRGDIEVDDGYIKSHINIYSEDSDKLHYNSVKELRLMNEISSLLSLDVENNVFNSSQGHLKQYGSPRKVASKILVDIISNRFNPNDWLSHKLELSNLEELENEFAIKVKCAESDFLCNVTVRLRSDQSEMLAKYLKNEIPSNPKSIISLWGLYYYSVTDKMSIATLPVSF